MIQKNPTMATGIFSEKVPEKARGEGSSNEATEYTRQA